MPHGGDTCAFITVKGTDGDHKVRLRAARKIEGVSAVHPSGGSLIRSGSDEEEEEASEEGRAEDQEGRTEEGAREEAEEGTREEGTREEGTREEGTREEGTREEGGERTECASCPPRPHDE